MSKVIKSFFCNKTRKAFAVGEEYTGKRTDIGAFLEPKAKENKKQPKKAIEKK